MPHVRWENFWYLLHNRLSRSDSVPEVRLVVSAQYRSNTPDVFPLLLQCIRDLETLLFIGKVDLSVPFVGDIIWWWGR